MPKRRLGISFQLVPQSIFPIAYLGHGEPSQFTVSGLEEAELVALPCLVVHHSFLLPLRVVIMCNINSAPGIEFNLLSFMGKLFNGKLNNHARGGGGGGGTCHIKKRPGEEDYYHQQTDSQLEWSNGILFKTPFISILSE